MLHEMVGVLSNPDRGAAMHAAGNSARIVSSWRTSAMRLRLEFVSCLSGLVANTKLVMMSGGQG